MKEKMTKKQFVEILLEKRFGEKNPKKIPCVIEINTFIPADAEQNSMGIGVQLIINDAAGNTRKEEYQVNKNGIVFSWGNTLLIDERSIKQKL